MSVENGASIADTLRTATARLVNQSDSPRLDAELLLCHLLGKSRSYLYTWPETPLSAQSLSEFDTLLNQRSLGEPLAYLTGCREFWSLPFKVTRDTLIPRADTELLVQVTIDNLQSQKQDQLAPLKVLDLGTGSGCIAISIAKDCPGVLVDAVDNSHKAIDVARENAKTLHANVNFFQSNWFSKVVSRDYTLIVSNPPYIDRADPHLLADGIRFEPQQALIAEHEGLADLRSLAEQSQHYLRTSGWLLLEHGMQQADAVRSMLSDANYDGITTVRDLEDRDRITLGRRKA